MYSQTNSELTKEKETTGNPGSRELKTSKREISHPFASPRARAAEAIAPNITAIGYSAKPNGQHAAAATSEGGDAVIENRRRHSSRGRLFGRTKTDWVDEK